MRRKLAAEKLVTNRSRAQKRNGVTVAESETESSGVLLEGRGMVTVLEGDSA